MEQATQVLTIAFASSWLAILISIVSAQVALDLAKRIESSALVIGMVWLLAAALALASGAWAVHVLSIATVVGDGQIGYRPWALIGSWFAGALLGAAGLGLAGRARSRLAHCVGGGALAGAGILTIQLGALLSIGAQPVVDLHVGLLAVAVGATLATAISAFCIHFLLRPMLSKGQLVFELAAAVVLGLASMLGATLAMRAARLPVGAITSFEDKVSIAALEPLASLGVLALLVMMMVSALIDARMRRELRLAKVEVGKQSSTDALTGLPNREAFEQHLDQLIARASQENRRVALLHVNIDEFRLTNEMLGPDKADRVLRAFAHRLRGEEKEGDLASRWVGDEFLMALAGDVRQLAVEQRVRQMLENLSEPFEVEGHDVPLTASIGVAIYPEHGDRSTLISHATIASRAAKSAGGSTYCLFEARLMKHARQQTEMLADLRDALAKGELLLFYQPKVHAPSGKITAAEALIRWQHPTRGWVSPTEFIPIAERFGLIGAIGNWVIEEACRQIREWRNGGLRMRVGINLSVRQLREPDLADRIAAALEKFDVNPMLLTCEITESLAMKDSESTRVFFQKLAAIGVHISIDDFGTGYSSLSYLRQLRAEELKIDRSFVLDLETSGDARAVVQAIIQLGLALNLKVVAEGVETQGQYEVLRQLGCDEVQGYLFAKPMPAKMLTLWAMRGEGPAPTDFRPSLYGETAPMPLK